MILWDIAPPLKRDTTDTKHVYMYQHSKHYVGVGSCFKGERCCKGTPPPRNKAIWSRLFFINNRILWQFLRNFCMKTDKFLSFFLTLIYVCKELSISISMSRFTGSLHISKTSATIVYPCITLILYWRTHLTHLTFGLTAAELHNRWQIKWYLMFQNEFIC